MAWDTHGNVVNELLQGILRGRDRGAARNQQQTQTDGREQQIEALRQAWLQAGATPDQANAFAAAGIPPSAGMMSSQMPGAQRAAAQKRAGVRAPQATAGAIPGLRAGMPKAQMGVTPYNVPSKERGLHESDFLGTLMSGHKARLGQQRNEGAYLEQAYNMSPTEAGVAVHGAPRTSAGQLNIPPPAQPEKPGKRSALGFSFRPTPEYQTLSAQAQGTEKQFGGRPGGFGRFTPPDPEALQTGMTPVLERMEEIKREQLAQWVRNAMAAGRTQEEINDEIIQEGYDPLDIFLLGAQMGLWPETQE